MKPFIKTKMKMKNGNGVECIDSLLRADSIMLVYDVTEFEPKGGCVVIYDGMDVIISIDEDIESIIEQLSENKQYYQTYFMLNEKNNDANITWGKGMVNLDYVDLVMYDNDYMGAEVKLIGSDQSFAIMTDFDKFHKILEEYNG